MTADSKSRAEHEIRFTIADGIALFIISSSVIFLQIVLMRSLSVTRYHHFSYLVISTALLGFGASGTFLAFFPAMVKKRFVRFITLLFLLFLISIPLSYHITERIPLDIQYIFYSARQVVLFAVYNFLIFIPFFFGATIIGSFLLYFKRQIPAVYGVNLFGSGVGGILAIGALFVLPATSLPAVISAFSLLGFFIVLMSSKEYLKDEHRQFTLSVLIAGIVASLLFVFFRPSMNMDQYKMMSHLERLVGQGEAKRLMTYFSPRSRIDVYDSVFLHQTMFAGLNADIVPPAQLVLLSDGQYAGSVFKIKSPEEARILDFTPQSVPYRMMDSPRVLLLGETGGVNVWLARRYGSKDITVVQGDPGLNEIMMSELSEVSGGVYHLENVEVVTKEPYLFLEQTGETYDIIQIVTAEGMSAGVSGLQSLHEDYLLTVESISKCYRKLTDRGMISITRGIQSPPRDNIKLFSLFSAALEQEGVQEISGHLLQSRNYLAMNTIITKRPLMPMRLKKYRAITRELLMDSEFYPGIDSDQIDQLNQIDGPDSRPYSYFHYAARNILSDERERFFHEWAYVVEPPTDNKPYFYDYFKWRSVERFIQSYGRQWFQRLELGYVVLVFTLIEVVFVALVLIIAPLLWKQTRLKEEKGKFPTILYFLCLGCGFMFIEMVFIQKFTRFMGSPLYSVSVALTSMLVSAGLGSLYSGKRTDHLLRRVRTAMTGILVVSAFYLIFLDQMLSFFISFSVSVRFLITALFLAPISFFMGWMFPLGLTILGKRSVGLIPWAWGVNGFASVSAAPLAVMLSMSFGFRAVLVIALALYLVAGSTAGLMEGNT